MAQELTVSGSVADSRTGEPLAGAGVILTTENGKTTGQSTAAKGEFRFSKVKPGKYTLSITFLGYNTVDREVIVDNKNINLRQIGLTETAHDIKEVTVATTMVRQEQRGDTTVFNAGAFKVHADATTEELLKKMPGITVEGSTIKAGGQQVKKVLVDGREFFGNDPMMAVKNFPAEVVDKIEVFDKQSDQAQFSGFNDGNEERTINITTINGKNMGRFGRAYAGYGSDSRYEAGGNINYFKGNRRISVIGLFNNINQQNFSFDDIVGSAGSAGRGAGMGGNFMTNNMGGITRTNSIGINFSNTFGKKVEVTGSYFFNNSNNKNASETIKEYFPEGDTQRTYNESSNSTTDNYNHRFNMRLTYQIDSLNSILFTPRVSWQSNTSKSVSSSEEILNSISELVTQNRTLSDMNGYSINGDLMWRHKFMKHRRTLSVRLGTSTNNSKGETTTYSLTEAINNEDKNLITNQLADTKSTNIGINTELVYTEPVGNFSSVMINYSPSITQSEGSRTVYDKTYTDSRADIPVTSLSSITESDYIQQRAGIGYNYSRKNFNLITSLNYQHSELTGDFVYPDNTSTSRTFDNIMPSLMLTYKKDRTTNLRLAYRTNTNAPSVSQIQNTVSVSNNRSYSMGNPDLDQQYTHNMMFHFSKSNPETSRSFFMMAGLTSTSDYIATATSIASKDSIIGSGTTLPAGAQLSRPVNLNGYYSINTFATYSFPLKPIRSNINFNLGLNFQNKPGMYNYRKSNSETYTINSGVVVGSNISQNVDFTLSYSPSYNILNSSVSSDADYNYFIHSAQLDFNYTFLTRVVLNNSLRHTSYNGLGRGLDQSYTLWNASLGVKFLRDNRAELKFKINDILNANKSLSRSITESYIATTNTQVLSRYCMVTLTFNLKKKGNQQRQENDPDRPIGPPPGIGRPGEGAMPPPPPEMMM
jgi:hypothetical protein